MVNSNEEMVQQMKRPQYRPQQPGSHGNMMALNMVGHKPYLQNVSEFNQDYTQASELFNLE